MHVPNQTAQDRVIPMPDRRWRAPWTGRASAYLALELHGPALSDLEHALSLDPQNFEALTGLGVILEHLDAPELALRAYDEVLAIHPHLEQVIIARSRVAEIVSGLPL